VPPVHYSSPRNNQSIALEIKRAAQVEDRKNRLSEVKRRLLRQRMLGMAQPASGIDQIVPRPAGAGVPLSAEQRRVWLHTSQQPDLPIYNEPFTIHRHGSFDLKALEASMNEILRRHEAWRTSFSAEGEAVIHSSVRVKLPLHDLSRLPASEREEAALRIATADAQTPIPLHTVPLFRARVVRMKGDEHRLYLTFHHIIFDGLSISRIFVPELSAIYAAFERGKPSPISAPALQYGDYAIWRESHVDSHEVKKHLAYWIAQLSGELPVLRLPTDRSGPAISSYRGSMEGFEIRNDLLQNLRRLSRERGVTLYVMLFAAFNVLLFQYSRQNDLIVGSAADARRRPELEGVMGYFLDTFAVRTRPSAKLLFSEYLTQTRDSVLGGLAAADVPFDRVVREINPKRNAGEHPIFRAFFSIRPPMPFFPHGWNLTQMDVTVGTSKFDLHLELCERSALIESRFLYNTDIWDASTIRSMAKCWVTLLESICENPETTLSALTNISPQEDSTPSELSVWNNTDHAFPQLRLDSLIEEQVRRTPHAAACAFGNERWTYGELNSRSDVIASLLRAAGVTRGSIVAIALHRSLDLLAGLIAVLKTGAAYLPIDVRMPQGQIAHIITDANPSAILTQRSVCQEVASGLTAIVLVDGDCERQNSVATIASASEPGQTPSDLEGTAYLIYTSGTTGEPKGVEVSHRSLVNLLTAMQAAPGFGPQDVFLAITPISFDIAALELFLPLISGGIVVIASREETEDPHLLASAIRSSSCTVIQGTPSTWRTLLHSGWSDASQSSNGNSTRKLRALCGGESLPRELANRLLATGAELWNMYGPTEATIWSLAHRVIQETEEKMDLVPVGRPIANMRAYILDDHQQPVGVGVQGELFLGGVGLAKGYRGRAQQTADRFFNVESVGGLRLYRTGDIAVRRCDGNIDILGRTDNQVKVRGHRVELEAVEAAVLRHPRVDAAAARAWPEPAGDFRLSVYVVAEDAPAPNLADMRAFLQTVLPDSMIPSDVIRLPSIPLTQNGKVDRARLPAPAVCETQAPHVSSMSSEEARLATIWSDLLGRKHVGLDDNFFDLGGHSLLIAALQQRILKGIGQRIPVAELFHRPTVRQQAELVRRLVKGKPVLPPGVIAMRPAGTRNNIFWVHSQEATNLASVMSEDQPFFSVTLVSEDFTSLGKTPGLQSIAALLARKILATQPKGPYTVGGFCVGAILAHEIACQLRAAGHEVALLVLLDAPNPAHLNSCNSLTHIARYVKYAVKRAGRLGVRSSVANLEARLRKRFPRLLGTSSDRTEMKVAEDMCETAALAYRPGEYEGKVLLLLASEHPPHWNYLPGWQVVIRHDLHVHYLRGRHADLLNPENAQSVGDAIASFSMPAADEVSKSCRPSLPDQQVWCNQVT
jgi:amino acid adenylation domain-containing protein